MALRNGLAAALRAIRATKQLTQTDLAVAATRSYIQGIEQAKSDVTIGKLEDLGAAFGFDPLTLLVLSAAVDRGETSEAVMQRVERELAEFKDIGGLEKLASQIEHGPAQARLNERAQRQASVQECKAEGMTQRETSEKLKLPKSTVADFWNLRS
ncbi:helix-turn-helix transcriptional regulator [Pseudomonas sp.]|uniref:helix-turn-helix transcriptional regulator n=1 Tax=Pseudomonas sp. TaxID=306 RepID=UPI0028A9D97D|nr:helix-turn-helix transcriptional regulator [Pseudomonas sp.]